LLTYPCVTLLICCVATDMDIPEGNLQRKVTYYRHRNGLLNGAYFLQGLQRDAQAALDYLLAHEQQSQKPIVRAFPVSPAPLSMTVKAKILYGRSLGGAVAIDLASRNPSKVKNSSKHMICLFYPSHRYMPSSSKTLSLLSRGWFATGLSSARSPFSAIRNGIHSPNCG